MFHDHTWHVSAILFVFMPCPEPPMGISSVGSFPVQSGGSLILFQLFRCRNLALNKVFSYFLVAGMFFILGGCLDAPTFVHPHTFIHSHTSVCPQGCTLPLYSSGHLYVLGGFGCCGGSKGLPLC